jgi:hypothetical protein
MEVVKKYGVVVCSKCHYPRGVKLPVKKSKCYHCGASLNVAKLEKFFETDSESELTEAVGKLNAKLRGGLEEYLEFLQEYGNVTINYEKLEPHKRIAFKLRNVKEPEERMEQLAVELSKELGEFEEIDIIMVLKELGFGKNQILNFLKSLIENNFIYEPKPGKYKIVD